MVSHLSTRILKDFIYFTRAYSLFICLAKLTKPHPVPGLTYLPQIPGQLDYTKKRDHQVLISDDLA